MTVEEALAKGFRKRRPRGEWEGNWYDACGIPKSSTGVPRKGRVVGTLRKKKP